MTSLVFPTPGGPTTNWLGPVDQIERRVSCFEGSSFAKFESSVQGLVAVGAHSRTGIRQRERKLGLRRERVQDPESAAQDLFGPRVVHLPKVKLTSGRNDAGGHHELIDSPVVFLDHPRETT